MQVGSLQQGQLNSSASVNTILQLRRQAMQHPYDGTLCQAYV
jgi:hypothetical protein